jgi:hypothetical protein
MAYDLLSDNRDQTSATISQSNYYCSRWNPILKNLSRACRALTQIL